MNKRLLFPLLLATLIAFQSLSQNRTLVFATYTYSTNDRLKNIQPVANWLTKQTGYQIRAVSYPTVKALIDAIRNDSVDFAMINTSGYLLMQKNHPGVCTPLVNLAMSSEQQTDYGGCIIASKTLGISDVKDIPQQKSQFALVSSSSTSGNLVPRLLLNKAGIDHAEDRFDVYYAGTHSKVVDDVFNGKSALGGCGCASVEEARKLPGFTEKIIVLDSFNDIPIGPFIANLRLDGNIRRTVSKALMAMHRMQPGVFTTFCEGWTEFKSATHFKPIDDHAYDAFRKMFGTNEKLWMMIE